MVNIFEVPANQIDPAVSLRAEDYVPAAPALSKEEIFLKEIAAAEELLERIDADLSPARMHASLRTCREAKQLRKTVQLMRDYIRAKAILKPFLQP